MSSFLKIVRRKKWSPHFHDAPKRDWLPFFFFFFMVVPSCVACLRISWCGSLLTTSCRTWTDKKNVFFPLQTKSCLAPNNERYVSRNLYTLVEVEPVEQYVDKDAIVTILCVVSGVYFYIDRSTKVIIEKFWSTSFFFARSE